MSKTTPKLAAKSLKVKAAKKISATSKRVKKEELAPLDAPVPHKKGPSLGARIRNWRRTKDWNLNELAERSGIAPSTLSKVENDILTLNYDRLLAVARAFGMGLSEFLVDSSESSSVAPVSARRSVMRYDDGEKVNTPNYEYHYLCNDLMVKQMVPVFSIVKARSIEEFGPLLRHQGEEYVFVLKGQVTVHTEFYRPQALNALDGIYLDSTMGHAYVNSGNEEAWIISVNTDGTLPRK